MIIQHDFRDDYIRCSAPGTTVQPLSFVYEICINSNQPKADMLPADTGKSLNKLAVEYFARDLFGGTALPFTTKRAEVSRQLCGMVGMPGVQGARGPMPDAPPVLQWCVCVLPVQSRAVRRCRGLDSAVQTLSPGDKDPPVLVRFMRTLISHSSVLTLSQPAMTHSPCTCPPKDSSPWPPTTTPFTLQLLTSFSPNHHCPSPIISLLLEPAGNSSAQQVLGAFL